MLAPGSDVRALVASFNLPIKYYSPSPIWNSGRTTDEAHMPLGLHRFETNKTILMPPHQIFLGGGREKR
jgi:hypothetical protein